MSVGPQSLGLGLSGSLALKVLTAPVERIALLLQTQDDIILNLRDESLAAHLRGRQHSINSADASTLTEKIEHENPDHDDDDEPRSIIVPYAQLPYTDAKDCYERLVEKEGGRSLWRGYSLECAFVVLQAWVAASLRHRPYLTSFLDVRRWCSFTTATYAGSAAWILSAAIQGTFESGLSMLAVYPLATLKTMMSTDVIRRTKRSKVAGVVPRLCRQEDDSKVQSWRASDSVDEEPDVATTPTFSADNESAEWINHSDDHQQENEMQEERLPESSDMSKIPVQEYEYELSYKYKSACDALQQTLASPEGFLGLYKGFSTVLVGSFISRLGYLAIYRAISPMLLWSASRSSGVGSFLLIVGATSVVNMMIYPLSTICHRRIVAAPGRYSSSWDVGKQLVEKHGWRALYSGVEVVLARSVVMAVLSRFFF